LDIYTTATSGRGKSPGGGNVLLKLAEGDVQEGDCPSGEMSRSGGNVLHPTPATYWHNSARYRAGS